MDIYIDSINDYNSLEIIIRDCKEKQRSILGDRWRSMYKKRCPKHYVDLEELTIALDRKNYINYLDNDKFDNHNFIWNWVYSNSINSDSLIRILEFLKANELSLTKELRLMACEACACEGCEDIKKHLGYTCEECKKDYHTGYQGRCEEQSKINRHIQ